MSSGSPNTAADAADRHLSAGCGLGIGGTLPHVAELPVDLGAFCKQLCPLL